MPFVGCSTYPDCDYSRPIAASWLADYADASAAAVAEKLGLEAADLSDVMAATAAAGSDSIPADLLEAAEGKDVETLEALRQMGMKGEPSAPSHLPSCALHPAAWCNPCSS